MLAVVTEMNGGSVICKVIYVESCCFREIDNLIEQHQRRGPSTAATTSSNVQLQQLTSLRLYKGRMTYITIVLLFLRCKTGLGSTLSKLGCTCLILFADESRCGFHPDFQRTRVWRQSKNAEHV